MRKVNIKTNDYTDIYAIDEQVFNANHRYIITDSDDNIKSEVGARTYADIYFQKGPVKENGVNGCCNVDLIAIVLDFLYNVNQGDFKCRENSIAITKLEEAMMWLNKRTADRKARGVEGTSQK